MLEPLLAPTAFPKLIGLEHEVGDVPLMKAFGEEQSLKGECGDLYDSSGSRRRLRRSHRRMLFPSARVAGLTVPSSPMIEY